MNYTHTVTTLELMVILQHLGVSKGQNIMVHSSLSSLGYVLGGAQTVIEALISSVGSEGTIIMPTQSWRQIDPEFGGYWEEPKSLWPSMRINMHPYNKYITPTNSMGTIAEMFRTWPTVVRSEHPARSFAAWGRNSVYLTENHDLSNIFGEGSPLAKLYELDGYILFIGVDYDKCTSLHLADVRAEYPSKHMVHEKCLMTVNDERVWQDYDTLYVDGKDFIEIGTAFEDSHEIKKIELGPSKLRLIKQRELVDFAVEWIEKFRK